MNLVPIKDIAKIHYGKALKKDDRIESGNVDVFGSNGPVGSHDEFLFEEPTVIIGRKGSVGKTIYTEEKSWTIDTAFYSEVDKDEVDIKYFYYALTAKDMEQYAITTSIPGINRNDIYDLKIPLPSLSEQKAIVAKLDRAQRLIDIDKEMLAKYDELIQSVFLEMFGDPVMNPKGWKVKSFNNMAIFDTNMTSDFEKYGDLLHVGIGNIEKETGKISDCKTAKEEGITSGKYLFTEEHIIYSKIRPYLNKVALPNFAGLCSADAYPIKPIKNVTTRTYLAYLLRSECFLDFISKHSTRTNIPKANKSQMKQFEGIVPPIDLQNQFEILVGQINDEKDETQIGLKKSEELFSSLVQGAFG